MADGRWQKAEEAMICHSERMPAKPGEAKESCLLKPRFLSRFAASG